MRERRKEEGKEGLILMVWLGAGDDVHDNIASAKESINL